MTAGGSWRWLATFGARSSGADGSPAGFFVILTLVGALIVLLRVPVAGTIAAWGLLFMAPRRWLLVLFPPGGDSPGEGQSAPDLGLGLVFSAGLSSLLLVVTSWLTGLGLSSALAVLGLLFAGTAVVWGLEKKPLLEPPARRTAWPYFPEETLVVGAFFVLGSVCLFPLPPGDVAQYLPLMMSDYLKHLSVTQALVWEGVPAQNPYLAGAVRLNFYDHYHALVAALCASDRLADVAFAFWLSSATVAAGCALSAVDMAARLGVRTRRGRLTALLFLSLLGGFDLVPSLLRQLHLPQEGLWSLLSRPEHADLWNPPEGFRISIPFTLAIWVPHHLLGGTLAAGILVWVSTSQGISALRRRGTALLLGALTGAIPGLSAYAGVFFLLAAPWVLLGRLHAAEAGRGRKETLARIGLWGGVALLAAVPAALVQWGGITLLSVKAPVMMPAGGPPPLFAPPRGPWNIAANYLYELGAPLLLSLLLLPSIAARRADRPVLWLALASLFVLLPRLFIVSTTQDPTTGELLTYNDFGMRTIVGSQVLLAALSGLSLERLSRWPALRNKTWRRVATSGVLALGVLISFWPTVSELGAMGAQRFRLPWLSPAECQLWDYVRRNLPQKTVVQANPVLPISPQIALSGTFGLVTEDHHAKLFGVDPHQVARRQKKLLALGKLASVAALQDRARRLGIEWLVLQGRETGRKDAEHLGLPIAKELEDDLLRQGAVHQKFADQYRLIYLVRIPARSPCVMGG